MATYQYTPAFTERARRLRHEQTDAERALWRHLRNRQIQGCKFYRQFPIGSYILDFFCTEKNIAVELDGGQHLKEQKQHDIDRTMYLKNLGIDVLRFWNTDVLQNIDGVLQEIQEALLHRTTRTSP